MPAVFRQSCETRCPPIHPGSLRWRGVQLHRAIDAYTDSHPVIEQLRRDLPTHLRRYAGILIDLSFDGTPATMVFDAGSESFYAVVLPLPRVVGQTMMMC